NHHGPRAPHPALRETRRSRRVRNHLQHADGRRRRSPAQVHRGQGAGCEELEYLNLLVGGGPPRPPIQRQVPTRDRSDDQVGVLRLRRSVRERTACSAQDELRAWVTCGYLRVLRGLTLPASFCCPRVLPIGRERLLLLVE